jgi:uncharacterized protein YcbK (DUF882 family)
MRKRGLSAGLAAAALSVAAGSPDIAANFGKTRTIALYNIHSKDTIEVVYKRDGKNVPEAMEKVNWALRDWRKNEPAKMDPDLVDLLWEIHTELGSRQPIHIISGFRSRDTNEMLRKTVGGQASESQHIQGKAADVHFPDVPLKQLRYSALIRERGGVGYYPTSAIPFVHVDTARVRHWPRLPRYELALLFPGGQSKHQPVDGGPITREDVKIAQARHKDLAVQVAEFFSFRSQPKGTLVADAGGKAQPAAVATQRPPAAAPRPQLLTVAAAPPLSQAAASPLSQAAAPPRAEPVVRTVSPPPPAPLPELKVASLAPPPAPRLVSEPRLIERPSRFVPRPSDQDRNRLDELVTLASFTPEPKLAPQPTPVERPARATASLAGPSMPLPQLLPQFMKPGAMPPPAEPRVAALTPPAVVGPGTRLSDALQPGWGNGYIAAPEFDEEHPDELSYRPFPVAPLLTASASPDDPVLSQLTALDVPRTLDLLDAEGHILPMRFHPGAQTAQLMWAQQFKGGAVNLDPMQRPAAAGPAPPGLNSRPVRTLAR